MIKDHYRELSYKYFINLFLEEIFIKIINISLIELRKSILNNKKIIVNFVFEMLKN